MTKKVLKTTRTAHLVSASRPLGRGQSPLAIFFIGNENCPPRVRFASSRSRAVAFSNLLYWQRELPTSSPLRVPSVAGSRPTREQQKRTLEINFQSPYCCLLQFSLLSRRLTFGELQLSLGQPKNLDFMRFLLSLGCEMLQTSYKHTTSHYSLPHLRTFVKLIFCFFVTTMINHLIHCIFKDTNCNFYDKYKDH